MIARRRTLGARGRGRAVPWLALASSAFAGLVATGALGAPQALALTPAGASAGQAFRLWTGHFAHFNAAHLWGDLLAFAVWAALVEAESRRLLAWTLLAGAPCVSFGILATYPELAQYRGLSALDCALATELLVLRGLGLELDGAPSAPTRRVARALGAGRTRAVASAAALAFILKSGYELFAGRALFAPDLGAGVKLLPAAHLLGVLLGGALVAGARSYRYCKLADAHAGQDRSNTCA